MKFKLAMGPAILVLAVGVGWLEGVYTMGRWQGFAAFTAFLVLLGVYSLRESRKTAEVLSETRSILIAASRRKFASTKPANSVLQPTPPAARES